jgi:hypothetical protein
LMSRFTTRSRMRLEYLAQGSMSIFSGSERDRKVLQHWQVARYSASRSSMVKTPPPGWKSKMNRAGRYPFRGPAFPQCGQG